MKRFLLVCLMLLVSCSKNITSEEEEKPDPVYSYKFTNNTSWTSVKVKANISADIQDFNLLSGESKIIQSKNVIENISLIDAKGTHNITKNGTAFDIKLGVLCEIVILSKIEAVPKVSLYYFDNDNRTVSKELTTDRIISLNNFTNDKVTVVANAYFKVRVNGNEKNIINSSYYTNTQYKVEANIKDIIKE